MQSNQHKTTTYQEHRWDLLLHVRKQTPTKIHIETNTQTTHFYVTLQRAFDNQISLVNKNINKSGII